MSGAMSYHAGLSAEESVARHYSRSGHVVREMRWRGQGGEIDLVVQNRQGVIFVEVKAAGDFDAAAQRVSVRQQQRIYSAASEYLGTLPTGQLTEARFDVALVNRTGHVQILENAFGH